MGYYMLLCGISCNAIAIWLMIARLQFRAQARIISGQVVDLVIRNANGTKNGARNKLLLISYRDNGDSKQYECEDAMVAAFYHIGDEVEVLVGRKGEKVMINNLLSLSVPSIALSIIGIGSLLGANAVLGWIL